MPGVERLRIVAHDAWCNPGEMPSALAAFGATGNHAFEVVINCHGIVDLPHQPPQIVREVEVFEQQQRELCWRPQFQRRDVRKGKSPRR